MRSVTAGGKVHRWALLKENKHFLNNQEATAYWF